MSHPLSLQQLDPFETFEARKESRKSLLGFLLVYLPAYFDLPPASFHRELISSLESEEERRLLLLGFRGSGKTKWGSLALPLWAALEHPEKYPFIVLIANTVQQGTLNLFTLKNELETNPLIKQDYGEIKGNVIEDFSLKGDGEEWQKQNIVLSNGVRILARARGQKVRGITLTSGAGNTTFAKFNPITDTANVIATLEESILDGAGWYFHRTVWAAIRSELASTSGLPFLFLSGAGNELKDEPGGGPIKPAGMLGGYPVYTNRWLPPTTVATGTQAGAPFAIFGNLKACAFGDKGDMRVAQFESGSFGGKEIALADQRGIVYKHRHAFVVVLPKAFTVISTATS